MDRGVSRTVSSGGTKTSAWPSSTSPPASTTPKRSEWPSRAGFAYVAPPAQGSNQYGYWNHQRQPELLGLVSAVPGPARPALQPLLSAAERGRVLRLPLDWRNGRTYYGYERSGGTTIPKYGSNGTHTQQRYGDNTFRAQRRL